MNFNPETRLWKAGVFTLFKHLGFPHVLFIGACQKERGVGTWGRGDVASLEGLDNYSRKREKEGLFLTYL